MRRWVSLFAVLWWAAVVQAGVISHWTLNETSSPSADSVGSNTCTWSGSVSSVAGQFGNAHNFANDSAHLDCGSNTSLAPSLPYSICFWIKAVTTPSQYATALGRTTDTSWTDGYGFYWNSSTELLFWVNNYANNVASVTVSTPTNWNHICGVYNGTNVLEYVNGVSGTSDTFSSAATHGGNFLMARLGGAGGVTQKRLDEVWVFDHAVSQAEIDCLISDNAVSCGAAGKRRIRNIYP